MDWLKGMNSVIEHIEENLTQPIKYESLSRIVGCSVYEFSRIFSFMAGMSVSEYIRRRRLSQAVFDIQSGSEKIIDIALKYCYESPTTFTRAFKELHGATPMSARKEGVALKTYPPISFVLTMKGVNEMKFRIEKRESFKIIGYTCKNADNSDWDYFLENGYKEKLRNGNSEDNLNNYYTAPLWSVIAYNFKTEADGNACIIGAELGDKAVIDGMDIASIPAATWAVFTIVSVFNDEGISEIDEAHARIFTESFPASKYARNENSPTLEVYPGGDSYSDKYEWEIWVPVKNK
jgi:AraC family transcriptional regulator